jgi:hypothetical protein
LPKKLIVKGAKIQEFRVNELRGHLSKIHPYWKINVPSLKVNILLDE